MARPVGRPVLHHQSYQPDAQAIARIAKRLEEDHRLSPQLKRELRTVLSTAQVKLTVEATAEINQWEEAMEQKANSDRKNAKESIRVRTRKKAPRTVQ